MAPVGLVPSHRVFVHAPSWVGVRASPFSSAPSPDLSARATKMKFVVPLLPCCMCLFMLFVFMSSSERTSCVARALRVYFCPPRISARVVFRLALDLGLDDIHRCAFPALVLARAWNVTCPWLSSRVGADWRPGERYPRRRTSARSAPHPASKAQCFLCSQPAIHQLRPSRATRALETEKFTGA